MKFPAHCLFALVGSSLAFSAAIAQPGSVDPSFDPGRGPLHVAPGGGAGVLIQPDGKIVVGGNFNGLGLNEVPPVVRLHPDGSRDHSFDASALRPSKLSASGATDLIPLALQPAGGVLIAPGQMNDSYGPRALLRLNADGSLDPTFNPQFAGNQPRVRTASVLSDGRILIDGSFTTVNGVARSVLARLNSDGSLDQTFTPARRGPFALLPDGRIIVASDTVYRLHSDGSLDRTFSADVPANEGDNYAVGAVLTQADGKVIYARTLNFFGTTVVRRLNANGSRDETFAEYSAQFAAPQLVQADGKIIVSGVRLNANGTVDPTFAPERFGTSVAQQADGKLVTADRFPSVPHGIRRLHLDGSLDTTFAPEGGGLTAIGFTRIDRAAVLPDGRVAVSGPFTHFGNVPRRSIAVLQRDGSVDPAFDAGNLIAPSPSGDLFNGSLVAQPDGKLLIAFRDQLRRLNPDGSVDETFRYASAQQLYVAIRGVTLQPDGRILLTSVDGLIRLLPDGSRDASFNNAAGDAQVLFIEPDGKIMVSGSQRAATRLHADGSIDHTFSGVGGVPSYDRVKAMARQVDGKYLVSRSDIAQTRRDIFFHLHPDGSRDQSFQPDITSVHSIVLERGGFFVGGSLATQAEAQRGEHRTGVARFNFDGTRDGTFSAVEFDARTTLLPPLLDGDGNLIVVGDFTQVKGVERRGIARIIGRTPNRLANISTRARVGTGESAQIGGFIITGASPKQVIVRAIGPSLAAAGVSGTLANPALALHDAAGGRIALNDNWRDAQEAEIIASGIPPADQREAAIVATLAPGAYTAVVSGDAGTEGVALVEIYDLDSAADAQLANISTRAHAQAGAEAMIAGFILAGSDRSDVVIRALGPSLRATGVTGTLNDPSLAVHDASGQIVAANDSWREMQQAELEAIGMGAADDREAALVSTFLPGQYTAVVRGNASESGVALVEVYRLK